MTVLVAHVPVLRAAALCFDDPQFFTNNRLVQHPGWNSAWRFLSEILEPSTVDGYYLPLSMISIMLDFARAGRVDNLAPFHATSLVLHIFNVCLVVLLLLQLLRALWPALFAAVIFGVHPLTVEPIAWIGERKTVLAAFFALICLNLYVRFTRTRGRFVYGLTLFTFLLALLSKPTTTPLPLLFLLLDYWPLNRLNRRAFLEKIPHLILAVASSVITLISHQRTAGIELPVQRGFFGTVFLVAHNLVFFLPKIVWPAGLSSHYPFPDPLSLRNPAILFSLAGSIVLIAIVLVSWRRSRAVVVGIAWFFVALFPTLGVIGFALTPVSDKYVYLPAVGLLLMLAAALARLWSTSEIAAPLFPRRAALAAAVAVFVALLTISTRRQISHWRDSETWARRMIELSPRDARPRLHLGIALVARNRIPEAVIEYRRIIEYHPDYHQAYNNLGQTFLLQRRFEDALEQYRVVLRLRPEWAFPHFNLANVLSHLGRFDEAVDHYRRALRIDPLDAEIHFNLANAFNRMDRTDDAVASYHETLRLDPSLPGPHAKLGSIHLRAGDPHRAEMEYRSALALDPRNAETTNNLGYTLMQQGRLDDAIQVFSRAIRLDPQLTIACINLGDAFRSALRWTDAADAYAQALRLDPGNHDLRVVFAEVLLNAGHPIIARRELQTVLAAEPGHLRAAAILSAVPIVPPDAGEAP